MNNKQGGKHSTSLDGILDRIDDLAIPEIDLTQDSPSPPDHSSKKRKFSFAQKNQKKKLPRLSTSEMERSENKKQSRQRRNIRPIFKNSEVNAETRAAQAAELCRLKRVESRDLILLAASPNASRKIPSPKIKSYFSRSSNNSSNNNNNTSSSSIVPPIPHQLVRTSSPPPPWGQALPPPPLPLFVSPVGSSEPRHLPLRAPPPTYSAIKKSKTTKVSPKPKENAPGSSQSNAILLSDNEDDSNDVVITKEELVSESQSAIMEQAYCDVIELSDEDNSSPKHDACQEGEILAHMQNVEVNLRASILSEYREDRLHRPDTHGRILVNVNHPKEDQNIFVTPYLASKLKSHQIGGIRFIYDNVIDSFSHFTKTLGFGCILAHSMGLGKTLQVIGFLDAFFRGVPNARSCLLIVPVNTLLNWIHEFDHWLPEVIASAKDNNKEKLRPFRVFSIRENIKNISSRHSIIKEWSEKGGVLLMGYEMFRLLLSSSKIAHSSAAATHSRIAIENDLKYALAHPGPQIVICDEGHRIKNSEAAISKALKRIQTRRRIVLTGYPLQNNLLEYWCMVDFVRPSYLGDRHEFTNMFQRPIENGQCLDSNLEDKKLMQGRAHVLHELLRGFVLRRSHAVLKASLPMMKQEFVICVRLSPRQRLLYQTFMSYLRGDLVGDLTSKLFPNYQDGNNTFKTYAMCFKIWNSLDILRQSILQQKTSDLTTDFDVDDFLSSIAQGQLIKMPPNYVNRKVPRKGKKCAPAALPKSLSLPILNQPTPSSSSSSSLSKGTEAEQFLEFYDKHLAALAPALPLNNVNYEWAMAPELWNDYVMNDLENSSKLIILFSLIDECMKVEDKVLVFSQSLSTLSVIETFLAQRTIPTANPDREPVKWMKHVNYFRLDGSTVSSERDRQINLFNAPNSSVKLFLLSTKAGCLGINLIAANRVVMLDASWNPCHDCQAVCRVYRYGQTKPTYIYRLIADNTMEKKIYDRQITKQGMADRVVDQLNPSNQFTRQHVDDLLEYCPEELPTIPPDTITDCHTEFNDPVLLTVLKNHSKWITKKPFTHESLLIDNNDVTLTRSEKLLAKQRYERERLISKTHPGTATSSTRSRDHLGLAASNSSAEITYSSLVDLISKRGPTSDTPALASKASVEYANRLAAEQSQLHLEEQRQLQKQQRLEALMHKMENARQKEFTPKPPQSQVLSVSVSDVANATNLSPTVTTPPKRRSSGSTTETAEETSQRKSGEFVEIIDNADGKFIRIPRTGEMFLVQSTATIPASVHES